LQTVCRFKTAEIPAAVARMQAGATIQQLCQDQRLTKRASRGVSYGNCGSSWIFNGKLGWGWVWEHYGVRVYDGIWYGTAQIAWYNYSTRGHNSYSDYIYRASTGRPGMASTMPIRTGATSGRSLRPGSSRTTAGGAPTSRSRPGRSPGSSHVPD
jgi:hypothetical protein